MARGSFHIHWRYGSGEVQLLRVRRWIWDSAVQLVTLEFLFEGKLRRVDRSHILSVSRRADKMVIKSLTDEPLEELSVEEIIEWYNIFADVEVVSFDSHVEAVSEMRKLMTERDLVVRDGRIQRRQGLREPAPHSSALEEARIEAAAHKSSRERRKVERSTASSSSGSGSRGPRGEGYSHALKVRILRDVSRRGERGERMGCLKDGMTVAQFIEALEKSGLGNEARAQRDLKREVESGNLEVHDG